MDTNQQDFEEINNTLIEIKKLLQFQLALELSSRGLTQEEIGKKLKIAKATVNDMLKGVSEKHKNTEIS
jgi:predicted XRE-type DNA-binding protein